MTLLELRGFSAAYGERPVLHELDLQVQEGEIVALLGANGAGKTTTLRGISGSIQRRGRLTYGGRSLLGVNPSGAARMGIAHVPEGRGTMAQLTVAENLRLGAYTRPSAEYNGNLDRVFGYFPVLRERQRQVAGTLSGGEQQMLAISRALMARPKLLLLDEPSLGLAPLVSRAIFDMIQAINRDAGVAVLLVEQNAVAALDISHRAYVLEAGRVAVSGDSDDLKRNDSVRRSYLGY